MAVSWREMREFQWIDLEDSWVLGWTLDPTARRLTFQLEASLWPGHPAMLPREAVSTLAIAPLTSTSKAFRVWPV